jgi:hypothetical protein
LEQARKKYRFRIGIGTKKYRFRIGTDAKKYSEDCSAFHHAIYAYLIQSNKEDAETLYQGLKNKNPQSS